jgi:hypothetical protein
VLIPREDKLVPILRNERMEFTQLGAAKTARLRELNRLQPELRIALRLPNVDMPWLSSLAAENEGTEAGDPENLGHRGDVVMAAGSYTS